jgi:Metal-dependent hydrolases of the beta-lactamase superfamily I
MDCVMFASGSKGNCIYIGNGTDAVVIDAGMGYVKRVLEAYKINTDTIRGLLITHEHSDHARSAKGFVNAVKCPVYATGGTHDALVRDNLIPSAAKRVQMHDRIPLAAGGLEITSFRTFHDAAEPSGFIVDDGSSRIGVCLDTHQVNSDMYAALSSCDAAVLESNYSSPAMQTDRFPACAQCRHCGAECMGDLCVKRLYPRYLKDRIREDGHLSNEAAADVIRNLSREVGQIALAHLSENYNRPNIARESAETAAGESGCMIYVSDQLPEYRERRLVRFSV